MLKHEISIERESSKLMKFDDFVGFDDELLSVNACFAFKKNGFQEVMTVGWINKKSKTSKT